MVRWYGFLSPHQVLCRFWSGRGALLLCAVRTYRFLVFLLYSDWRGGEDEGVFIQTTAPLLSAPVAQFSSVFIRVRM